MEQESTRILIVDDESLVGDVIEHELTKAGYSECMRAMSGLQALELCEVRTPDIVLLDIEMPHLSGLETARRILERHSIPIIMLTAHDQQKFVSEASELGVSGYLVKPPRHRDLDRAITVARARHADMRELRRLNRELQEALDQIKVLHGLLPICSHCKKIRDEQGEWQQLEKYIRDHSEATFSHGICPHCLETYYPESAEKIRRRGGEPAGL